MIPRCQGPSTSSPRDPLEVLLGLKTGTVGGVGQPEGERVSDIEEEEEVEASPLKTWRRPYTRREQQEIVDYLVKKRAYSIVKGNTIWQRMEVEQVRGRPVLASVQVCKGRRTWQSMKEHFRKQVMAKIHTFGLDWKQVAPLKVLHCCSGEEAARRSGPGRTLCGRGQHRGGGGGGSAEF